MGKFTYHVYTDNEADARELARAYISRELTIKTRTGTRTRAATNIRITEAAQDKTGLWTITGTMTPNISEVQA